MCLKDTQTVHEDKCIFAGHLLRARCFPCANISINLTAPVPAFEPPSVRLGGGEDPDATDGGWEGGGSQPADDQLGGFQRLRPPSWVSPLGPAPLGRTYPERGHRGQVHVRGAGDDLVSRQDACSRRGSSAGGPWPTPAPCSPRGSRTPTHEAPAAPIAPLGPRAGSAPAAAHRSRRHALTRGREAPRQGTGQLARADEAHAHGPGLGARGSRRNRPTRAGDAVGEAAGGESNRQRLGSRIQPLPPRSRHPPRALTWPRPAPPRQPILAPGARGGPIRGRIAAVRPPPL